MFIEVDRNELQLLTGMVESRMSELQPEIRRCRNHRFEAQLKAELATLEQLLHRLHEAAFDVTA